VTFIGLKSVVEGGEVGSEGAVELSGNVASQAAMTFSWCVLRRVVAACRSGCVGSGITS